MNHSVASLQAKVTQVSAQNAALTTQVDELKRPSRILSIALNQLHMKYANPVNIPATPSASK
jgi:cell division protein FtsL